MTRLRLAYRDHDRTPVIFCIQEMARRHYGLDVEVVHIKGTHAYEAALFDGTADVIMEHLEYLYEKAASGEKVSFLCAPSKGGNLELVVQPRVNRPADLKGGCLAVRPSGQPHAIVQWLRMIGLDRDVSTAFVDDDEVGRWGQWKRVASGDCVAAFMSPLHTPQALAAGLKIMPVPALPIVGHYAQACLARFAADRSDVVRDYVKAVVHAVWLMIYRRDEALAIVRGEPMTRMKIADDVELERQFDAIVRGLKPKAYPTPEAVANTYEIATVEYPGAAGINPLALWDLHWLKELDDQGFIDGLMSHLGTEQETAVEQLSP
jgi:hypothetical protein